MAAAFNQSMSLFHQAFRQRTEGQGQGIDSYYFLSQTALLFCGFPVQNNKIPYEKDARNVEECLSKLPLQYLIGKCSFPQHKILFLQHGISWLPHVNRKPHPKSTSISEHMTFGLLNSF